jgi:hypothetical protein
VDRQYLGAFLRILNLERLWRVVVPQMTNVNMSDISTRLQNVLRVDVVLLRNLFEVFLRLIVPVLNHNLAEKTRRILHEEWHVANTFRQDVGSEERVKPKILYSPGSLKVRFWWKRPERGAVVFRQTKTPPFRIVEGITFAAGALYVRF